MKTANLTGAQLDYWVARAEGIPADQLEIREAQRSHQKICVLVWGIGREEVRAYSTSWALGGPLIEKHITILSERAGGYWAAYPGGTDEELGATPLQAVCRAVVRDAFGDEVGDLPCA